MNTLESRTRRCVDDYNMISPGEKIAVGVSGGKDSLMCLSLLSRLRVYHPARFELEAITLDMGFPGVDMSPVSRYCEELGVRHTIIKTDIAEIVFDIRREPNPCSLCAKMRRGALHEAALNLGCRKVALGHHGDDAVETFWMSLMFEGRLNCFRPVTWLDRRDITLIRPLLYIWEDEVISKAPSLPVVKNPCPANGNTQRQTAKETLRAMESNMPGLRGRILGAMQRLPLPGWGVK